jgi:hypothetical protein
MRALVSFAAVSFKTILVDRLWADLGYAAIFLRHWTP